MFKVSLERASDLLSSMRRSQAGLMPFQATPSRAELAQQARIGRRTSGQGRFKGGSWPQADGP